VEKRLDVAEDLNAGAAILLTQRRISIELNNQFKIF